MGWARLGIESHYNHKIIQVNNVHVETEWFHCIKILWIYETHVCDARCRAHAISSSRMNLSFRHKWHSRISHLTWDGQPNSVRAWQRTSKGSCPALRLTQLEAMNRIRHAELLYLYIDTVWGVPCFHAFSRFIHFFHLFSRSMNKEKSTFSTGRSAQAEVLQKIQDDPKTEPRHNVAPDPQIPWFSSLHSLRSSFHKLGIRAVLNGVFQMHTTVICSLSLLRRVDTATLQLLMAPVNNFRGPRSRQRAELTPWWSMPMAVTQGQNKPWPRILPSQTWCFWP